MRKQVQLVALLVALALCQQSSSQSVIEAPLVRGIASVRIAGELFVAVWRVEPEALEIYRSTVLTKSNLVATFYNKGPDWQTLNAIDEGAVGGFQLRTIAEEGPYGGTTLFTYAKSNRTFRRSYSSENISDVVDMLEAGYPIVLEYLGGRAVATDKVRIHVWRNDSFVPFSTVRIGDLHSPSTIRRLVATLPI